MGNEKSDENFLALFDYLILQSLKNLDARDDITFCQKKEPFFFSLWLPSATCTQRFRNMNSRKENFLKLCCWWLLAYLVL